MGRLVHIHHLPIDAFPAFQNGKAIPILSPADWSGSDEVLAKLPWEAIAQLHAGIFRRG
jgi:hypothetical protein